MKTSEFKVTKIIGLFITVFSLAVLNMQIFNSLISAAFINSDGEENMAAISGMISTGSSGNFKFEIIQSLVYFDLEGNPQKVGAILGSKSGGSDSVVVNISNSFISSNIASDSTILVVVNFNNNQSMNISNSLIQTNSSSLTGSSIEVNSDKSVIIPWDFNNNSIDDSLNTSQMSGFEIFDTSSYSENYFINNWALSGNDSVWLINSGESLPYLFWQEEPLPEQIINQP